MRAGSFNSTSVNGGPANQAANWARIVAADRLTVFLDTETTGLGHGAEIVDIAIVDGQGNAILDTLVRPIRPIPFDATRVHGIRDHDVVGAPTWEAVHPRFLAAVAGRRVVVYNAEYDRGVIDGCCRACDLEAVAGIWECAMLGFAAYRALANDRRPGQFRWHKLEIAAQHFGLPEGGHRALGDALACRAVVFSMAGRLVI